MDNCSEQAELELYVVVVHLLHLALVSQKYNVCLQIKVHMCDLLLRISIYRVGCKQSGRKELFKVAHGVTNTSYRDGGLEPR